MNRNGNFRKKPIAEIAEIDGHRHAQPLWRSTVWHFAKTFWCSTLSGGTFQLSDTKIELLGAKFIYRWASIIWHVNVFFRDKFMWVTCNKILLMILWQSCNWHLLSYRKLIFVQTERNRYHPITHDSLRSEGKGLIGLQRSNMSFFFALGKVRLSRWPVELERSTDVNRWKAEWM